MKNGTKSSRLCRLQNLEEAKEVGLSSWTGGNWSMPSFVDSQSVKTPDQAGERGYDAGKKISRRKRHIAVDCLRMFLAITITSAAMQDRDAAKNLITLMLAMYQRVQIIWADGGYLGALVQWVKQLRQPARTDCTLPK